MEVVLRGLRISRRRFLSSTVAASSALGFGLGAQGAPCVLQAEQEVGPFYLDRGLVRRKIAEDRVGIPLRLRIVVVDSRTCAPLKDAAVDIWHCDAMGLYSGFTEMKLGPPPEGGPGGPPRGEGGPPMGPPPDGGPPGGMGGPPGMKPTDDKTFLRGIQLTGEDGGVVFETIFPGFYQGRTNHVHFKVRLAGERSGALYKGGHTSHVGQVFFTEQWNDRLMQMKPYANHGIHRTTDSEDDIYQHQHGALNVATLVPVEERDLRAGLVAELRAGVDPTATPKPVGGMGGPPPRRD